MKSNKILFAVSVLVSTHSSVLLAHDPVSNDFPTLDRVEYVIACMKRHGGENYDTLYGCACAIDYLSTRFSYDEFNEAQVYRQLRRSPGERGGVFRDPDQAGILRDKLSEVEQQSLKHCHLKPVAGNG